MCKTVMLRAYTILCIVVVSTGIRAFSIYIRPTVNQSSLDYTLYYLVMISEMTHTMCQT